MVKRMMAAAASCLLAATVTAQPAPLDLARRVADKVVDNNTSFDFELRMQPTYPDLECIDFGASMPAAKGVAYGLTTMRVEAAQKATFQVGRTGPVKIWIDGKVVFEGSGTKPLPIEFTEKYYKLDESFQVDLTKGDHKVLVKTQGAGGDRWLVLLQSLNMSNYAEKGMKIKCTLDKLAPKVTNANWLVAGVYDGDMSTVCRPEGADPGLYELHTSGGRNFLWNIPRVNLLVDNKDGGRFYHWSYHVGCFMWSLQRLSAVTGEAKYIGYADRWCDHTMRIQPIVDFQTRERNAVRSMNFGQSDRPMLDYYSAPAMPFVTRLAAGDDFAEKAAFEKRALKVVNYLRDEQFRVDGIFARDYLPKPTVWADDMFMGLPYLVYWAKFTPDAAERAALLDDASNQIIGFNKFLYVPETGLYRQACYPSDMSIKVPFWSRGNGWALWATAEVLQALPKNHRNYKALMKIYRDHVDGLLRWQDADGFWRNILDMETSVRESSGAAIFTLNIARGINNGWLDKKKYGPILEKSWSALITFADEKGDFNGVKKGTNFSTDPMDYERVAFAASDTHGLLPFVFACIEMDKYQKENKR